MTNPDKNSNIFISSEDELKSLGYKEIKIKSSYLKSEEKPIYKQNDFVSIDATRFAEIKSSILVGKEIKGEVRIFRKS